MTVTEGGPAAFTDDGGMTGAIRCWGIFRLERGPMAGRVAGVVLGRRMVGRIEGIFDVFGRRMVLRGAVETAGVAAGGAGRLKGTFLEGGGGWRGCCCCEAGAVAEDPPPIMPPMKEFFM